MTTAEQVATRSPARGWHASLAVSWPLLAILFVAEFAFFSIRFDTGRLTSVHPISWLSIVGSGHLVIQFMISILAVIVVFRGAQISQAFARVESSIRSTSMRWMPLAAHLSAMLVFYQLTAILLEGDVLFTDSPTPWAASWVCVGVMWIVSGFAVLAPLSFWWNLVKDGSRWLLVGAALAGLAVIVGQYAHQLWRPLSRATLLFVDQLLRLVYSERTIDADRMTVGTEAFSVEIAPECSGYEGIGLAAVFLSVFLWVFRRDLRFPRSLLLLPIGCVAMWLANGLRIAALIAIGTSFSPNIALGGFHSQAGWLAFNVVTLGLVAVAWNSSFFAKRELQSVSSERISTYPSAPYLVPFLVLVGASMFTEAFSNGAVDWFYPLRVVVTGIALCYFIRVYRERQIITCDWSLSAVATGILVFVVWMLLEPLAGVSEAARSDQAAHLSGMSAPISGIWILMRIVGLVIIVPIAEELAFRGYLVRRLQSADFERVPLDRLSWFALIASSICFGMLHGRWIAGILAGMAYGWIAHKRGRLFDAVLAHATTNALIAAWVLWTGDWSVWS